MPDRVQLCLGRRRSELLPEGQSLADRFDLLDGKRLSLWLVLLDLGLLHALLSVGQRLCVGHDLPIHLESPEYAGSYEVGYCK